MLSLSSAALPIEQPDAALSLSGKSIPKKTVSRSSLNTSINDVVSLNDFARFRHALTLLENAPTFQEIPHALRRDLWEHQWPPSKASLADRG